MFIKGLESVGDTGDTFDLEEIPTAGGSRWALDFRGVSVPAATKDPEAQKAELAARLRRIEAVRDKDPWADLAGDVGSISRQVKVLTSNVEVPADATHKIVGGFFADSYAKAPRLTEDGKAFYVIIVSGLRKSMSTRVDFDQFVKVDDQPDYGLRNLLSAEVKGKPSTIMEANKLRKK